MKARRLLILVCILCISSLTFLSQIAIGQEFASPPSEGAIIFGYTSIDYDPDTKVVTAYSETDVTAGSFYYFVTTQLNSTGCSAEATSRVESDVAAQCSFQGSNGNTYTAYGTHIVGYFVNTGNGYDDPYGLSLWPQYSIENPWEFPFTSQGTETTPETPEVEMGETYDTANTTIPAACGDQRDTIIAEYEQYDTPYYPSCSLFTQNTGDPVYTFTLLNQGSYQWAILRTYFISDLDSLAKLTSFTETSAYRNPAKEASVDQQIGASYTPGSRHQYGDAIDVASSSKQQWETYQTDGHKVGACVEPSYVQGNFAHAHLDWRTNASALPHFNTCPFGW